MNLRQLVILMLFALVANSIWSLPEDLSIAAYEEFTSRVESEVEKILEEEFQKKEEDIKKLSQPYRRGDHVTITIIQGDRKRQISGIFKGIKGQYAEIDDRSYLLSDIEELDGQRLFFADQAQMLQLKINQLRKQMEEERAKRREILLDLQYKEAGYTKEFFDSTVELSGRFWPLHELGDGKIALQVEFDDTDEFVSLQLLNATNVASRGFVLLGDEAVYTIGDAGDEAATGELQDSVWNKVSFRLLSDDVAGDAGDPISFIQSRMRIWIVKQKVGGWQLRAVAEGIPATAGTGQKAQFNFRLIRSSIRPFNRALESISQDMLESAQAYRDRIKDRIREIEKKAEKERLQHERELQERAAKIQELERAKKAREEMVEKMEKHYSWMTADFVTEDTIDRVSTEKSLSKQEFDDLDRPTVMDGLPVTKFTDWTKVPSRSREFYGRKYRIIRVDRSDNEFSYHLQYQVSTMNPKSTLYKLPLEITVKFEDGSELSVEDQFDLGPTWAGTLYGIVEIPEENMVNPVDSFTINKTK